VARNFQSVFFRWANILRECFPSSSYRPSSRFEDYGRLFVAAFSTYPFHGRFYEMSRPASRMEGHIKRTWQVIARVSMDRSPSWLSTRDCQRANSLSFSRSRSCRPSGEHLRAMCYRVLQQYSASFNLEEPPSMRSRMPLPCSRY